MYKAAIKSFPAFAQFMTTDPAWYKDEMDYGVARRLLHFAVELRRRGELKQLRRLMQFVENEIGSEGTIADALVIDFVQPIADLDDYRDELLSMLGPRGRRWYDAQWTRG